MAAYEGDYFYPGASETAAAAEVVARAADAAMLGCGLTPTQAFDASALLRGSPGASAPFAAYRFGDGVSPEIYVRLLGLYFTGSPLPYSIRVDASGRSDFLDRSTFYTYVMYWNYTNGWFEADFTDSSLVFVYNYGQSNSNTRTVQVIERAGSAQGAPQAGNFIHAAFGPYAGYTSSTVASANVHRDQGSKMLVSSTVSDYNLMSVIPGSSPVGSGLLYLPSVQWANGTRLETMCGAVVVKNSIIPVGQTFDVDLGGVSRTYRTSPSYNWLYNYDNQVHNIAYRFG